ncbi:MAG: hypothetical protein QFF03_19820 [Pseudomonadota bacterium]|nr:hypothetical protein [Pseudomonadota bacterium]
MTNAKDTSPDLQIANNSASLSEAHAQIALEQAALYAARQAIARWTNGSAASTSAQVIADPAASRASWYAQAQRNFQEWLGHGGFAQYDIPCAEPCARATADGSDRPIAGNDSHPAPTCAD